MTQAAKTFSAWQARDSGRSTTHVSLVRLLKSSKQCKLTTWRNFRHTHSPDPTVWTHGLLLLPRKSPKKTTFCLLLHSRWILHRTYPSCSVLSLLSKCNITYSISHISAYRGGGPRDPPCPICACCCKVPTFCTHPRHPSFPHLHQTILHTESLRAQATQPTN